MQVSNARRRVRQIADFDFTNIPIQWFLYRFYKKNIVLNYFLTLDFVEENDKSM